MTEPTVHDMTRMALAETAPPRVLAAFDALTPNRAGHPPIGALGFLSPDDLVVVVRAADLAHGRARTPGWAIQESPEDVARDLARTGSWRYEDNPRRAETVAAVDAYRRAIIAEREAS